MHTQLTDLASIEQILQEMTLAEKARLVTGGSPFHSEAMPEYGIPAIFMLDSCGGINSLEFAGDLSYRKTAADAEAAGTPIDRETLRDMGGLLIGFSALQKAAAEKAKNGEISTPPENGCYPTGILLGATWNPEAVEACGRALAREMGSKGIDMILGPNINIQRDPRCGRLAESFSEDPYLVSILAPAMVKGIQDEGLLACPKHFAANNQETDRMIVDAEVSERALREIYLPGFRACVEGGCKTVMSAYNKVNGTSCSMHRRLLTEILRGEWGFTGFVVSDWGGTYDQVTAVAAGNDLTMPGPRGIGCIIQAVEEGRLPEAALDSCIRNFLHVVLDTPVMKGKRPAFDTKEAMDAAELVAKEGIVLLQNDGALPIPTSAGVAFYGKRSKVLTACSGGSGDVLTSLKSNPYDRAVEIVGKEHVCYESCMEDTRYWIVTVGADAKEGADRTHLHMDADDRAALDAAICEAREHDGKVIVACNTAGPIDFSEYADKVSAVVCCFFPGMQGGKATADVLFGLVNPSGKLPLTWPMHDYDCPAYKNFPGENKRVLYGEGVYVGYRWYDARHIAPLYPFGHGLSYTSFALSPLIMPDEVNVDEQPLSVTVHIKNTGSMTGSEVVQVYVNDVESKFDKPYKALRGFQKVRLEPGEETDVTITLTKEDFGGYCPEQERFVTEPGAFDILVGNSASSILRQKRVTVRCKNPFGLTEKSGIGQVCANPAAVALINSVIGADILAVADVALNFAPDKPWKEIWEGTAMTSLMLRQGLAKDEIDKRYQTILTGLDAL